MIRYNKIKKIFCVVLLAGIQYSVNADTSKAQLLSSMSGGSSSSSAPGGLVNNNVTYGGSSSSQPQQQTQQVNTSTVQSQSTGINLLNQGQSQQPAKKVIKKKTGKKVVKKPQVDISNQKIDITYFGDVSGVPNLITQYFPGMTVAAPLGKANNQSVSFDMQSVSIDDISSMIQSLTGGSTRLIYNQYQNTIRISYVTVNQVGSGNSKLSIEQHLCNPSIISNFPSYLNNSIL